MSNQYYWHSQRSTFSRGKGKPPVGFGEKMPSISPEQEKLFLEKGWISTEKTVTARQLSELDQLREQVAELKKGGDSAEVEKLKAENAELKSQLEELTAPSGSELGQEKGKPGPKPKGN